MRAITYERYGPPDVLRVREVPDPAPKDGEILIRVRAAEATKGDCELRGFRFPVQWYWLPLRLGVGIFRPRRRILGGYFAGEVEAVCGGVDGFTPGDAVFGAAGLRFGAYGEKVVLPASATVVPKPSTMSFVEAAAVPLGGLNALHFLRLAAVQPGESVLINGAGGSIGAHAIQIARTMGGEVTAVDSGMKEAFVRALGAAHFVDYTREQFTDGGRRYDVIFDMVPRGSYADRIGALAPGGRYLTANPRLSVMLRSPLTTRLTGKRSIFAFARETRDELLALKTMIEAGRIQPIVDQVFPMEAAAEAHRRVEAEQRLGAIVIDLDA